jgi:1,4-dihydroxy-2-naphthoate octaprenyltransferase
MARSLAGFLAYVRPTFMIPAVGMSIYGAVLSSGAADSLSGALHAGVVGVALYVAHLRDGYVDGHRRGEEVPRLTVTEFRWGILTGGLVVVALSAVLFVRAGALAAVSTVTLLALALLHAPYLDRHPLTVTVDYPIGVAVALLGGYATQTGGVTLPITGVAAAFVGLLSGIKVGIDRLDADFDRSIGKRTVPVAYGTRGAERLAAAVFGATAVITAAVGVGSARPTAVLAAATVPVGCLLATVVASPERAVRIRMALTYVFAVLLFLGVCDACVGITIGTGILGLG